MPSWFQLAQLLFALLIAGVIAERVRALYWLEATSDEAVRWLVRSIAQDDIEAPRAWARARPRAHVARVIESALVEDREHELRELLADLREEAVARLQLLRVAATLASTTGLLGGILSLAGGASQPAGLLALRAGEVERLAMAEALTTMAVGVALSALCFQALALLRPAAQKLIAQVHQVARAVSSRDKASMLG